MKYWFLYFVTFLSLLGSLLYVFLELPPEISQGYVQKIFFFHVPSAFAMYFALISGAILSGIFLFERKQIYDQLARACLYTATFFSILVIISGPIWAKPIWGVYWTWDPRLTTTFVVFILLVGYCFIRALFQDREGSNHRGSLIGSIVALLAVLDVPLVHYSVKLWRGVHPSVIQKSDGLPENYRMGLELMVLSILLLAGLTTVLFYKLIKISELKADLLSRALKSGGKNA
ncbi:MAG: ccmC [Bacteriovoracaceae bacterium]|nr:ccmC [Bacteriovoracaceae bacterium]